MPANEACRIHDFEAFVSIERMTHAMNLQIERVSITKDARLEGLPIVPPAEAVSPAGHSGRASTFVKPFDGREQTRIIEVDVCIANAKRDDDELSSRDEDSGSLANHGGIVIAFEAIECAK